MSHRIHVWSIYLHLPYKSTIHVGKYTSLMDPMGVEVTLEISHFRQTFPSPPHAYHGTRRCVQSRLGPGPWRGLETWGFLHERNDC